jgi:DNA-binding transcriptional ArsR family regulator
MSAAERAAAAGPAPIFAALADPTRLAMIARLSDGASRSIVALAADSRLTRQAVTKHLEVLRRAGLVEARRAGRETRFAFRPEAAAEARAWLDAVGAQWEDALGRLKAHVEG